MLCVSVTSKGNSNRGLIPTLIPTLRVLDRKTVSNRTLNQTPTPIYPLIHCRELSNVRALDMNSHPSIASTTGIRAMARRYPNRGRSHRHPWNRGERECIQSKSSTATCYPHCHRCISAGKHGARPTKSWHPLRWPLGGGWRGEEASSSALASPFVARSAASGGG
jgi:hypothetical protein